MEEEIHKWYISAGVIGCFHNWESKTALNAKFILTISPKSLQIAHIWWMNLNHIISGRRFWGLNLLTRSWRVSIHCPITLYPGVLLIFIWYWKRSYRPGASPFRLNVTDVPALPTKERIRLRNLPSKLSDENTVYESYIKKKPWHASQTTRTHCLHFHSVPRRKFGCHRNTNNICLSGQQWRLTRPDSHRQPIVWRTLPAGLGTQDHKSAKTQSTVWLSRAQMKCQALAVDCWHILITLVTLGLMDCAR